jgi:hypothetical protein
MSRRPGVHARPDRHLLPVPATQSLSLPSSRPEVWLVTTRLALGPTSPRGRVKPPPARVSTITYRLAFAPPPAP